MFKSHPGWVPFENPRVSKTISPPDDIRFLSITLSRARLMAASRVVLGGAVPMTLVFLGIPIYQGDLVPLIPILVLSQLGILLTTGGTMLAVFNGMASFLMATLALCLVMPLTIGQPWIAVCLSLALAWIVVFCWSWMDQSRRSIAIPRIFAVLLLLSSFQAKTLEGGWRSILVLFVTWMTINGATTVFMVLTTPLCMMLTKDFYVFLFNAGVMLDAATLPLQNFTNAEHFPHFTVLYPHFRINHLRESQVKHMLYITSLLREAPFEITLDQKVGVLGPRVFGNLIQVQDCISSIMTLSSQVSPESLNQKQWKLLYPAMEDYVGAIRLYMDRINSILQVAFTNTNTIPSVQDMVDNVQYYHNKLFLTYTQDLKQNGVEIPGTRANVTPSADHHIFQLLNLFTTLNDLAESVIEHVKITSKLGIGYRIGYYIKAAVMPFVLTFVNAIFIIRCLAVGFKKLLQSIGECCCCKSSSNTSKPPPSIVEQNGTDQDQNQKHEDQSAPVSAKIHQIVENASKEVDELPLHDQIEQDTLRKLPKTSKSRKNRRRITDNLEELPTGPLETSVGYKVHKDVLSEEEKEISELMAPQGSESSDERSIPLRGKRERAALMGDPKPVSSSVGTSTQISATSTVPDQNAIANDRGDINTAQPKEAYRHTKRMQKIWMRSLTLTTPVNVAWKDWVREGRWKFPVTFIITSIPVTILSVAFVLYWTPHVDTPWAISSALIVLAPSLGGTWARFGHRMAGTILGAFLAQITIVVASVTSPYVIWGPLILVFFVCTYGYFAHSLRFSYFYMVTALSYAIVLLSGYPYKSDLWRVALYRGLFVLIGALWASICALFFPERAYEKYLTTMRAAVTASHSAILMIHDSIEHRKLPDVVRLKALANDMTNLHLAAVALRFEAATELFFSKPRIDAIRCLRYKLRDLCYTTRMQIQSATNGFGSTLSQISPQFIKDAQLVLKTIQIQVNYIDTQLYRKNRLALALRTDNIKYQFHRLEQRCQRLKGCLQPLDRLQLASHLRLLRLYCVIINDLTRLAEHYSW